MKKLYRRLVRHLREIWHRLRAPTPAFWRKVQKRSAAAALTLTPLLALFEAGTLKDCVGAGIVFFTAVATMAQLTCDDTTPASPTT